jgi:5-histidylcysteine sulfoxide synthase/putative 4-mercaptohistidine N1-methyltranferase
MTRNPNISLEDIFSLSSIGTSVDAQLDPLIGERPNWWWTGARPDGRVGSLPLVNLAVCSRQDVFDYFSNGWLLTEVLFSALQGEQAFIRPPYHHLRHPMIFYYGHVTCFFVNKLRVAGLIDRPINEEFERLFEVGVDEMSWDDMSKNQMEWPSVQDVNRYRQTVFATVSNLIATHPGLSKGHAPINQENPLWALFMGMEHERIHLETSSVLIRELPIALLRRPHTWPDLYTPNSDERFRLSAAQTGFDCFVSIPGGDVRIGKPLDWPSYGWDNEYGVRQSTVSTFEVSKYLVTNGQFLEFVKANGYQERRFWSERGWRWRAFRNSKWPTFWVAAGPAGAHTYKLRTIFEVIELPHDWPVCVNFHEAKAYLAWRSARDRRAYRLPTEAEHVYMRRGADFAGVRDRPVDPVMRANSQTFADACESNLNLAFGSETPVSWSRPGLNGVHDVAGNVWDWCEDDFHPLDGFKVHPLYDDFSTPCFDGEHSMILGGSFMSTGDEASIWARFHFRNHFLQHAGFRVVASSNAERSGAVHIREHGSAKYENASTLDQYLLFNYGEAEDALPRGMPVDVHRFPQRCATKVIEWAKQCGGELGSVLDVGCAVGAAAFSLAHEFKRVTAVDISASFIEVAEALRRGESRPYRIKIEGDIHEGRIAIAPRDIDRNRVEFRRTDACSLPSEYMMFDAVLAANLLCRLPSPKAFLSRLGGSRGLVRPGGIVVFASPFSWSEQFTTKSAWLGGFEEHDGEEWSAERLASLLSDEFELLYREDIPFMLREHRRKYEYVISDLTVWRRKSAIV